MSWPIPRKVWNQISSMRCFSSGVPGLWSLGQVTGSPRSASSILGVSFKWWYPLNNPKWSFFVGKPMVVGYHHFRKPPFGYVDQSSQICAPYQNHCTAPESPSPPGIVQKPSWGERHGVHSEVAETAFVEAFSPMWKELKNMLKTDTKIIHDRQV